MLLFEAPVKCVRRHQCLYKIMRRVSKLVKTSLDTKMSKENGSPRYSSLNEVLEFGKLSWGWVYSLP